MYERSAEGWAKHLDFILLDMICLEISLALAYMLRHGIYNPFTADSYRNLSIVVLFLDFALLLFLDTLKNVLKRGAQIEAAKTVRHTVLLTLVLIAYLFAIHDEHDYSRVTIFSMGLIYCILTLTVRMLWKKVLRQRTGAKSGNSLLILSSEKRAPEIMGQLKKYNYGHYEKVAWVFHDDYKVGMTVEGIPVVATYDTVEDYVKRNWVDEVLIAVPAYDPFPRDIIDQLTAMGVTVHVNLDKSRGPDRLKAGSGKCRRTHGHHDESEYDVHQGTAGKASARYLRRDRGLYPDRHPVSDSCTEDQEGIPGTGILHTDPDR